VLGTGIEDFSERCTAGWMDGWSVSADEHGVTKQGKDVGSIDG
jgi:hypothetical protein